LRVHPRTPEVRNTHTAIVADSSQVVLVRTQGAEPPVALAWVFARGGVVVGYAEDKKRVRWMGRGRKRTMMDQAQIPYTEAEVTGVYVEPEETTYSH